MAFDFQTLMYGTMQIGIRVAHPQAICAFTTSHTYWLPAMDSQGCFRFSSPSPQLAVPVRPTVTCVFESTFEHLCDARGDKPQNDTINININDILSVQCSPRTQFSKSPWSHVIVLLRMMHCIICHLCFLFHSCLRIYIGVRLTRSLTTSTGKVSAGAVLGAATLL
ncbi:hypothetical protein M405DRAFT_399234 [Rhizopogon salebrosus TDB-379]|nr:hypothetical protein M405DRAFT_399234 [Rhizopogon salebrosus TDB-379]